MLYSACTQVRLSILVEDARRAGRADRWRLACLDGLVKAGGDVAFVFKNNTFFVLCVVLPAAIAAASLHMPAWVVFACLKCDQILKCFVAVVKINRFNWMKNLTRDTADTPDAPDHGGVPLR